MKPMDEKRGRCEAMIIYIVVLLATEIPNIPLSISLPHTTFSYCRPSPMFPPHPLKLLNHMVLTLLPSLNLAPSNNSPENHIIAFL